MVIGIEASRANRSEKTGVEWYAYHVIQEMKKLPEASQHSWLLYGNSPLAHGLERNPSNWHEVMLAWPPKYLWTQIRLSFEMYRASPEVLFVPAHVLPRVIPKRTVVTIHDVGFHRMPDLYKPRQVRYHEWSTRDIVKRAAKILTVSAFSKQEIVDCYGANPDRIVVTYPGIDPKRYQPAPTSVSDSVLQTFRLSEPYLLFVGRLEKKKNILTLIRAFIHYKNVHGADDPLQLVLAGQPGLGFDEIEKEINAAACKNAIHRIGYVNENEKIALLSRALALVHPSWYEGFGIPPIEAMACGCPVIASHVASLPEVIGAENGLWFDPQDAMTLVQAIERLVSDPVLHEELRAKGLARSDHFAWSKTAKETLQALTTWT